MDTLPTTDNTYVSGTPLSLRRAEVPTGHSLGAMFIGVVLSAA